MVSLFGFPLHQFLFDTLKWLQIKCSCVCVLLLVHLYEIYRCCFHAATAAAFLDCLQQDQAEPCPRGFISLCFALLFMSTILADLLASSLSAYVFLHFLFLMLIMLIPSSTLTPLLLQTTLSNSLAHFYHLSLSSFSCSFSFSSLSPPFSLFRQSSSSLEVAITSNTRTW